MDVRFKYVIRLLLVLVSLDCAFAVYSEPIYGDVNEDELVDIDDINAVINSILKKGTYAYSDVNCDGATDVDDINHIINIMLHKSGSLAAPTNVKATRNGNAIFVTWDAVANAESYSVYISNDGLNYKFVVGGNTECSCFDSSPLLGKVTYKVKAVSHNAVSEMSEASSIVQYGNTFYSGLFLGVWGFNTRLYQIPISWLDETTISHFTNYINWFQTSNGTALFYAVDNAMSSVAQNSDLQDASSVTLVTFTDGLDHGSTSLNENYATQNEYLGALKNRIQTMRVNNRPIHAYTIGLKGDDVADMDQFNNTLESLSTDHDHVFVADNLGQVSDYLQKIAHRIYIENIVHYTQLTIIREDDGARIRFTFDNIGNQAANSQCYIEGTFDRNDNSLVDVVYHGLSSASGSEVMGTRSGMFTTFRFQDVKLPDDNIVPLTYAKEFIRSSNGIWQVNSEFSSSANATTETDHRKAVVLLALDGSSSLYSQFGQLKVYVNSFIETLAKCKTITPPTSMNYPSALSSVQFYTNDAHQFGAWRSNMACGDWTRSYSNGGSYFNMSIWNPTASICTSPYQWWFVGAYGASHGLWGPEENIIDIYDQAIKDKNYAYAGVARVLKAYGMMTMADLYGEIPCSEATKGSGVGGFYRFLPEGSPRPKYDNGKILFMGCIADIEEAISLLEKAKQQGDVSLPSLKQSDCWNDGDVSKWLKLAYLLKARWLNHLVKKEAGSYRQGKYDAAEILACLDKAMQSNADNSIIRHTDDNWPFHDVLGWDEPTDYSPLFSLCGMNAGYMATKMLEDNLTNFGGYGVEDPRADKILPWAYSTKSSDTPAEIKWDGHWRRSLGVDMSSNIQAQGGPMRAAWGRVESRTNSRDGFWIDTSDAARWNDTVYVEVTSDCKGYFGNPTIVYHRNRYYEASRETGSFYTRVNSPTYVGTFAECCFIRAEVLFNQGNKAGAFEAYKKGIKASMEQMNVQLNYWCENEPGELYNIPSFKPITMSQMNEFLENGIGAIDDFTLGHIMTQKRIAMHHSLEIWNDMRRYDYNSSIFFNWQIPAYHQFVANAMQAIPEGKQLRRWQQSSHELNYNGGNLQEIGNQVPGADLSYTVGDVTNWNKAPDVWTIPVWWDSDQQ